MSGETAPERVTPPERPEYPAALTRIRRGLRDAFGLSLSGLTVGLIVLTGWAAWENIARSGWGSDAAAWVQASGSIAAIAGAAWLAQTDARRARRERRRLNEEAAWYVRFAIAQAQFESQIVAAALVNRTDTVTKADLRDWRSRVVTSATALSALVGRTDHIHPVVTQVTANTKMLMDELVIDLANLAAAIEEGQQPSDDLVGQIVAPHRALLELLAIYDERMLGIGRALDKGGDVLPIGTWRK